MSIRPELDASYAEAVALAERARGWFDGPGAVWRAGLAPADQAAVAVATLATTARLLAAIAWLLDPVVGDDAPLPALRVDPGEPPPAVLAPTPGGAIAAESRALVVRLLALAQRKPVISASYIGVWRA